MYIRDLVQHWQEGRYAFEFDPACIHALAHKLRLTWEQARADLLAFTVFLQDLSRSA